MNYLVWTINKNDSTNHPFKQIIRKDNKIELFDKSGEKIIARQQLTPLYYRNGIDYKMNRDCLLNKETYD